MLFFSPYFGVNFGNYIPPWFSCQSDDDLKDNTYPQELFINYVANNIYISVYNHLDYYVAISMCPHTCHLYFLWHSSSVLD